jgi:hypothetical protein
VTVAPQADSAIIALRFDEVREMLRTSLAQHAEQLQVLLSGALASAGGEAPTPQDAVSVSPGGEPVVRPASPSEPAPPPAVDAATPLESVQPPSTVPDGHVDAGTEVI